jgi:hypothetical protein
MHLEIPLVNFVVEVRIPPLPKLKWSSLSFAFLGTPCIRVIYDSDHKVFRMIHNLLAISYLRFNVFVVGSERDLKYNAKPIIVLYRTSLSSAYKSDWSVWCLTIDHASINTDKQ